jgi:mannose-6-phosphate isomerase-like protein (cupin superfamily)
MFHNHVKVYKWPHNFDPSAELMKKEMEKFGYKVYDLQTLPGWFKRSAHAHDYEEIRGAVEGCITFHFDKTPITIEAGDIIVIPSHTIHTVISHNSRPFSAYKGNAVGERRVTEHGDGKGSVEDLGANIKQ